LTSYDRGGTVLNKTDARDAVTHMMYDNSNQITTKDELMIRHLSLLKINAHLKNFIFSVKKGIKLNNYRMALIACAFFVAYSGADAAVDSSSPDGSKRLVVIESATDGVVEAILYSRHNGKTTKQDISLGELGQGTVAPDELDVIWPDKGPYVVLFCPISS